MSKKKKSPPGLIEAVCAVAAMLEVPRDRLGRLDPAATSAGIDARGKLRELAIRLKVGGSRDSLEQCAKVLRAAVEPEQTRRLLALVEPGSSLCRALDKSLR